MESEVNKTENKKSSDFDNTENSNTAELSISAPEPLPEEGDDSQNKKDDLKNKRHTPVPIPHAPGKSTEDVRQSRTIHAQTSIEAPTIALSRSSVKAPTPQPSAEPSDVKEARGKENAQAESTEKTDKADPQLKISCHKCYQKLDVTYLEPFAHFNCPSCGTDLIVPKWFDNYLLEEHGGVGGMAIVYRALDLALDREVAIKILNPEVASQKESSELFLHEARTAATINHYAVVPIYTCGEFKGQPFIVMQYMTGGSLEDSLLLNKKEGLPVQSVLKWIRDVAEGLDNAHRHGIVHHDIKPGNIMLDNDENAKICDFGIAQAVRDSRTEKIFEMTKSWVSPHYVSPEKVNTGNEDYLGDIYSLGATFYNLITGKTPFDHNDVDELIRMRTIHDPEPPIKLRSEIGQAVSDLILQMMSREKENRPNYRKIIKTLTSLIKSTKNSAKKSGFSSIEKTGVNKDKLDQVFKDKIRKRNPLITALTYLVLLLGVCGIGYYAFKSPRVRLLLGLSSTLEKNLDYAPELSSIFNQGNSKLAAQQAREILENVELSDLKRRQAGLQLVFANYLNQNSNAKDNCASIAERLKAIGLTEDPDSLVGNEQGEDSHEEIDPVYAIAIFLSKTGTDPDILRAYMPNDENALGDAAELAIFLRGIVDEKPKRTQINSFLKIKKQIAELPETHWLKKSWGNRLKFWELSIRYSTGDPEKLEPVFASKIKTIKKYVTSTPQAQTTARSQKLDIASLSAATLKKAREFAAGRPKPDSFVITGRDLDNYLATVPSDQLKTEKQRAVIVDSMKHYLCSQMMRFPYEGKVELKDKRTLNGVLMANVKYLSLKLTSGKRVKLEWTNITFKQFCGFLDFYANIRNEAVSSGVNRKEVAGDYLRLGILCDWYGDYEDAVKYAKRTVEVDSGRKNEVLKFFMD